MSSSEWREVRLGDIAKYSKDRINLDELTLDNYISTENMLPQKAGKTIASSLPTGNAIKFKHGQTLISNIRPYFKKIWYSSMDGGCSADVLAFDILQEVDSKYFYYLLSQDKFFDYVMAGSKGTKMPRGDKQQIMMYPLLLPDISEQKAIADTLSCLDDKIELNNRINKTLEEMAQTIFKSWFVDFDPFQDGEFVDSELGRIPKGWRVVELGDLNLDISDGNYSSKYPRTEEFISEGIPFIRGTDFEGKCIKRLGLMYISPDKHQELKKGHTKKDDILITTRGEIGKIAYLPDCFIDANINSQLVRINGGEKYSKYFLGLWISSDLFQNDLKTLTTGSALQQLPVGKLKKAKLIIPPDNVINEFNKLTGILIDKIILNSDEVEVLATTRNVLLPKLMSGEIRVPIEEVQ
jgi:type I restriction enzyme, S subunit